jgi:hypothetical protein
LKSCCAAHPKISRVGVSRSFALDPIACCLDKLNVQRFRETAGNLVLGFREPGPIGLEPVRPKMRSGFGIDQLHVDLNLSVGSAYAPFVT